MMRIGACPICPGAAPLSTPCPLAPVAAARYSLQVPPPQSRKPQQSAVSVQAAPTPRQQWRPFKPTTISQRRPLPLQQRFFLPLGLHDCWSFRQRFFFFPASLSIGPPRPSAAATAPPAARPKRRLVQASNRVASIETSSVAASCRAWPSSSRGRIPVKRQNRFPLARDETRRCTPLLPHRAV